MKSATVTAPSASASVAVVLRGESESYEPCGARRRGGHSPCPASRVCLAGVDLPERGCSDVPDDAPGPASVWTTLAPARSPARSHLPRRTPPKRQARLHFRDVPGRRVTRCDVTDSFM